MKVTCLLRKSVLVVFLMIGCFDMVFSDDRVMEDQYTVKINGVSLRRDIAEGLLLRVESELGGQFKASEKIKKGVDINIEKSELLSKLSVLYEMYLSERYDSDTSVLQQEELVCLTKKSKFIDEKIVKLKICVDKSESTENRISYLEVSKKG